MNSQLMLYLMFKEKELFDLYKSSDPSLFTDSKDYNTFEVIKRLEWPLTMEATYLAGGADIVTHFMGIVNHYEGLETQEYLSKAVFHEDMHKLLQLLSIHHGWGEYSKKPLEE